MEGPGPLSPPPPPEPIRFGIDQILGCPPSSSSSSSPPLLRGQAGGFGGAPGGVYGYPAASPGRVIRVPAHRALPPPGHPHGLAAAAAFPWVEGRAHAGKEGAAASSSLPPFCASSRRVGHPYQNRTPPKRKKPRTSFSRAQIAELERRFQRQKYLASGERAGLAKALRMSDAQVKTWFQNRRTKWRRQTAEEREAERQQATRVMLQLRQEAFRKGGLPPPPPPPPPAPLPPPSDPLCAHNSSLFALQNLQPWAQEHKANLNALF